MMEILKQSVIFEQVCGTSMRMLQMPPSNTKTSGLVKVHVVIAKLVSLIQIFFTLIVLLKTKVVKGELKLIPKVGIHAPIITNFVLTVHVACVCVSVFTVSYRLM